MKNIVINCLQYSFSQELNIQVNGYKIKWMVKGNLFVSMVLLFKDNFLKGRFMEEQKFNLPMEIRMMDNGNLIKLTDLECIIIIQVLFTKVTGQKIYRME